MNKTALIIVTIGLLVGIGVIFFGGSNNTENTLNNKQNIEIKDGIQYITIHAKGGYSPKVSLAKADIPTKLVVTTNGTYDCSVALVIKSIGYQRVLKQTGEEIIDLGLPQAGTEFRGTCSMGMYNFKINFD